MRILFVLLALLSWCHPSPAFAIDPPALLVPDAVERFYRQRGDRPGWDDNRLYDDLITAIRGLADHGLDPERYHLEALEALGSSPRERERLATDAWLAAAAHLERGRLDPASYAPDMATTGRAEDLGDVLSRALESGTVGRALAARAPSHREYVALMQALSRLPRAEAEPVINLTAHFTLRPGLTNPHVAELQQRLVQLDLMEEPERPGFFDGDTATAVRTFQRQAGLKVDAYVGPETRRELNRLLSDKRARLQVNLERWRWLPRDLGRRHVRVNVAGYTAATFKDGVRQLTHAVIVGQRYRETPVFSDEITHVILNPWWDTPRSIARKDKLPLFRNDPDAVQRLGFHVLDENDTEVDPSAIDWESVSENGFPYRLRQEPGPFNALGRLKIMFPNEYSVYLHDTPNQQLFQQHVRTFSSGCVRVQDAVSLASWVLAESGPWSVERLEAEIDSGGTRKIDLREPVPVHVLYFTVIVDDSGTIRYLDDIYARDTRIWQALTR